MVKTNAVGRSEYYCFEQQQQKQQQQKQQQPYQLGNITSTFFALENSEWRDFFQEVWQILVIVGIEGAMVL